MVSSVNYSSQASLPRRIFLFVLITSFIEIVRTTAPYNAPSSPRSSNPNSSTPASFSSTTTTSPTSILEIYEIETYNESSQNWQSKTWIRSTGELSVAAPEIVLLDEYYQFTSSWKIDVSGHRRDELGWEYFANKQRRRHWLRTYQQIKVREEEKGVVPSPSSKKEMRAYSSSRSIVPYLNITEFLSNQYNFKGFGCFLSKSLIYKKSCGVSLSFPITSNIDFLERRPYIPAVRGGARIAYGQTTEWMVACYFSVSLPRVIVKSWYANCWDSVFGVLHYFQRKNPLLSLSGHPSSSSASSSTSISSSAVQAISEKIGVTLNFCYSPKNGYEFLPSCWFIFLPTLQHIINTWVSSLLSSPVFLLNNLDILKYYTSSMGLATSLYPYQTCSLAFSISGFYLPTTIRRYSRIKQQKEKLRYEKLQNERIKEMKEILSDKGDQFIDSTILEDEGEGDSNRNYTANVLISSSS